MMKFMAFYNQSSRINLLPIRSPCAGYYTNIRMIARFENEGQDPKYFFMGTDFDDEVATLLPDSVSALEEQPDLKKNGIFIQWVQKEQLLPDGRIWPMVTKHWGKKKVYVDDDSTVKIASVLFSDNSQDNFMLVQADFCPKKGALYRKHMEQKNFSVEPDFTDPFNYTTPFDLDNVVVEIAMHADTTLGAGEFELIGRLIDGDENPDLGDTFFTNVLGDVVGEVGLDDKSISDKNTIIRVHGSVTVGGNGLTEENIEIPKLRKGQTIVWAMKIIDGSPVLDVHVDLSGIVANRHYSNDANFIKSSYIRDLGQDVGSA